MYNKTKRAEQQINSTNSYPRIVGPTRKLDCNTLQI